MKIKKSKTHQFCYLCGLWLENPQGNLGHCLVSHQSHSGGDSGLCLCWTPSYCWFPKGWFCQSTPPPLAHSQWSVWSSANTNRRAGVGWVWKHFGHCNKSTEPSCGSQENRMYFPAPLSQGVKHSKYLTGMGTSDWAPASLKTLFQNTVSKLNSQISDDIFRNVPPFHWRKYVLAATWTLQNLSCSYGRTEQARGQTDLTTKCDCLSRMSGRRNKLRPPNTWRTNYRQFFKRGIKIWERLKVLHHNFLVVLIFFWFHRVGKEKKDFEMCTL